jgi:hypothetical protein
MHNHLADKSQLALVLRLTVDRQGQLAHGEVVGLGGEVIDHFTTWPQLADVLQSWIASRSNGLSDNRPYRDEM